MKLRLELQDMSCCLSSTPNIMAAYALVNLDARASAGTVLTPTKLEYTSPASEEFKYKYGFSKRANSDCKMSCLILNDQLGPVSI